MEHFVCAKCEKPFLGNRHYERKGLAYCEMHYHQLFGNLCYVCNQVIQGDIFTALNKAWQVVVVISGLYLVCMISSLIC